MLFSRPSSHSLPPYLLTLLDHLEDLLRPLLAPQVQEIIFHQPLARQVILNLYPPGSGISPHIDLSNRYADGILGVSLIGGAVMHFIRSASRKGQRYDAYLPARSVYVLTGEVRWEWEHGIDGRMEDVVLVEDELGDRQKTVLRETRVSVTFRWLQDGGDVLS